VVHGVPGMRRLPACLLGGIALSADVALDRRIDGFRPGAVDRGKGNRLRIQSRYRAQAGPLSGFEADI
jgi:hypothetical protein